MTTAAAPNWPRPKVSHTRGAIDFRYHRDFGMICPAPERARARAEVRAYVNIRSVRQETHVDTRGQFDRAPMTHEGLRAEEIHIAIRSGRERRVDFSPAPLWGGARKLSRAREWDDCLIIRFSDWRKSAEHHSLSSSMILFY